MKIKKYPQSHLVLEKGNTKIIIDPGVYTFQKGFDPKIFQGVDAYLITHQHQDHLDPENIKALVGEAKIYGNFDVVGKLKSLGVEATEIVDREIFEIGDFKIQAIDLPHGKTHQMPDMPPNTGYLIDPSTSSTALTINSLRASGILFHPGDGVSLKGLSSPNFALPVAGPGVSFESALKFAKDLNAKTIIPIHFDSPKFPADPIKFVPLAQKFGMEVKILNHGEEIEI